jgi:hypothetical protein
LPPVSLFVGWPIPGCPSPTTDNFRFGSARPKVKTPLYIYNLPKKAATYLGAIQDEIEKDQSRTEKVEIAVITFYRAQERKLRNKLKGTSRSKSEVSLKTVDSVQGQEADIVLLCFTTWDKNRFYNVPNRLNVALTRSRQRLFLFGNPEAIKGCSHSPALQALCSQVKSQIISL